MKTTQLIQSRYKAMIAAVLTVAAFLCIVNFAHGESSFFATLSETATATSTLAYQTPGTGTTTLVYDSYQCQNAPSSSCPITGTNENGTQNFLAADSATLLLRFTASSTLSRENINFEYSNDGIDWYQATVPSVPLGYATTTLPIFLNIVPQYAWQFASSTLGGSPLLGTNNTDTRAIPINTPVRYERAVMTCALGGLNCAVWAEFIPKKQNP